MGGYIGSSCRNLTSTQGRGLACWPGKLLLLADCPVACSDHWGAHLSCSLQAENKEELSGKDAKLNVRLHIYIPGRNPGLEQRYKKKLWFFSNSIHLSNHPWFTRTREICCIHGIDSIVCKIQQNSSLCHSDPAPCLPINNFKTRNLKNSLVKFNFNFNSLVKVKNLQLLTIGGLVADCIAMLARASHLQYHKVTERNASCYITKAVARLVTQAM